LLGIAAVGGATFYFVQQKSPTPVAYVDLDSAASVTEPESKIESKTATHEPAPPMNTTINAGVGNNTFVLGKLYTTPNDTPTLKVPQGWSPHVLEDYVLTPSQKVEYRTFVTFADSDRSHVLVYALFSTQTTFSEEAVLAITEEVLGIDQNSTIYSLKKIEMYGLPMSEGQYTNVKQLITGDKTITYNEIARVFYVPGYIVLVAGASKAEPASQIADDWFNKVFETLTLPSPFNAYGSIPLTQYVQFKSKFAEVADKVDAAHALPKGTASDFYLSTCPQFALDLTIGDSDKNKNGEVSKLQKLLFEKYSVSGNITGRFDDLTLINTIRFQREMGLEGTGGVGANTRAALARCKTGSSSSAPSATVNSLNTSSQTPILSGTAAGLQSVYVTLSDKFGEGFWHTDTPVSVINGHWSVTVSIPNYKIPAGVYTVRVNGPDNPNSSLPELARGTLTVTN